MNPENPQSPSLLLPTQHPFGETPSSDSNLPQVVNQELSEGERALAAFASQQPSFVTSLPCSTSEDFERISVLMAVSDAKSKNCAGQTLAVIGFAADFGPVGETQDGEVIEGVRAHILLDDGKSIFTTSRGILKALRDGLMIFKHGLWSPPALLEIRQVSCKRGDALVGVWRGRKGIRKPAEKSK